MDDNTLDDRLDELVARYSDALEAGQPVNRRRYLEEVPAEVRPGLERCLRMIEAGSARTPSAARPLVPGLQLDHYELVSELGRGGMAVVWLARDPSLQRSVALKILRPGLALEERNAARFRREALVIAQLVHPHVVQVFGAGETHGYHYIAMELVEGPSLATILEALPTDRPRTPEDLARAAGMPQIAQEARSYEEAMAGLLAPVVEALISAHELGLVHRDIKPSNILFHRDGRAVLADFGLAKGGEDPALSLTGDPLGTPYYMSPEQAYIAGATEVDHRTDIYSLGVTLFEALTGKRPFQGDSFLEVIEAIRTITPPSVRSLCPTISRNASAVVARAMDRDPERRYPSASELYADLVALSTDQPTMALRKAGNPLRQLWLQMRLMSSGQPYEYVSPHKFLGLPLVHVISGPRRRGAPLRRAKGWIAAGDVAYGALFASGLFACGGVACGLSAFGVFTFSAVGLGLFVCAAVGMGFATFSGISIGALACGGVALGYVAIGGFARGIYVAGGNAEGRYRFDTDPPDPEAERFFGETVPSWFDWLG